MQDKYVSENEYLELENEMVNGYGYVRMRFNIIDMPLPSEPKRIAKLTGISCCDSYNSKRIYHPIFFGGF